MQRVRATKFCWGSLIFASEFDNMKLWVTPIETNPQIFDCVKMPKTIAPKISLKKETSRLVAPTKKSATSHRKNITSYYERPKNRVPESSIQHACDIFDKIEDHVEILEGFAQLYSEMEPSRGSPKITKKDAVEITRLREDIRLISRWIRNPKVATPYVDYKIYIRLFKKILPSSVPFDKKILILSSFQKLVNIQTHPRFFTDDVVMGKLGFFKAVSLLTME